MADYELHFAGQKIATLTNTGGDCPWFHGSYVLFPAFEKARSLFAQESALLDADRIDEWDDLWTAHLAPNLSLRPLDGSEDITRFLIHFDKAHAWWRY